MKAVNLFGAALTMPQWIIFGICALGVVFFLLVFCYFIYKLVYKPDLKAVIANKAGSYKNEAKNIKSENQWNQSGNRGANEVDKKAGRMTLPGDESAKMRAELMYQGIEEERAIEISNMTISQLQTLKNGEMIDASGAYIINAITRRLLIDTEFERRTDVEDFKVPINKTTYVAHETVEKYLSELLEAEIAGDPEKSPAIYKIDGKTIALLYNLGGGKFQMKFKCGPLYGFLLNGLYPEFIEKSAFPHEMMWFILENKGVYSFELIKLLIDISYTIAKAGF